MAERKKCMLIYPVFLFLSLISGGCWQAQDTIPPSKRNDLIVVLGSSTAAGDGASDKKFGWVSRYEDYLQTNKCICSRVVNLAVGGYTTYHILPSGDAPVKDRPKPDNVHNITYALTLKPTAIIINLPTNDVARGYTLQEIMDNYARIVKIAAPIPVWITTPQPRNFGAVLNKRSMELKRLTEQTYGSYSVDFWSGLANEDGSIKREFNADNIHVNDQGHELLFKKILQARVTAIPFKVQ